jgi:hypothetical protein
MEDSGMAGEHLDLSSDPAGAGDDPQPEARGRRFVGIHFVCCDVYSRVYVNRQETAYVGHCPRCMRKFELKIGPGGTDARFFQAG